VAAGIVACLEKGRDGTSYILGGHYVTIRQIFDVLHDDLGMRKTRLYVPLWVARLFLPLFTLWYKLRRQKPVFSRYSLFTLGVNGRFSSERAESELGFVSRPFPDIIKDAVTWLRKEGRISPG
jgi:dihydroflavonol-4-reductase